MAEFCPLCGQEMTSSDNGESGYRPGGVCWECQALWCEDDLQAQYRADYFSENGDRECQREDDEGDYPCEHYYQTIYFADGSEADECIYCGKIDA